MSFAATVEKVKHQKGSLQSNTYVRCHEDLSNIFQDSSNKAVNVNMRVLLVEKHRNYSFYPLGNMNVCAKLFGKPSEIIQSGPQWIQSRH